MIVRTNNFSTTVHTGQWIAFLGSLVTRAKQVTSGFKIPGVILAWLWLSQRQNYPHAEYITNPNDDCLFLGFKRDLNNNNNNHNNNSLMCLPKSTSTHNIGLYAYLLQSILSSEVSKISHNAFLVGKCIIMMQRTLQIKIVQRFAQKEKNRTFHLVFIF